MEDAGSATFRADGGDGFFVAAGVTDHSVGIGVEGEGKEAIWAEDFFAAILADSHSGGAAAIMKNEGLVMRGEVSRDGGEEVGGKIAVFAEFVAIL